MKEKVGLIDILIILAGGKKFILIFTAIISIITITYSLLVTEKWTSQFTVVQLVDASSVPMSSGIMDILGFRGASSPIVTLRKYSAILKSRPITEVAIRKFDLLDYFEINIDDELLAMEEATQAFHSGVFDVEINEETLFLTVRVTTNDRYFSKSIAQFYLDFLESYSQNNLNNIGRQKRELLENRIEEILNQINELTDVIMVFQKENSIIDIEQQARLTVQTHNTVINELIELDLEIDYLTSFLSSSSLNLPALKQKRQVIINSLRQLEIGFPDSAFILPLNSISKSRKTIEEKVFELELKRKTLETLYPQLELARLEEINDMDRLEIIEPPNIPGRRSFPQRARMVIFAFLISLLFSCFTVIFVSQISDEDKEKIKILWKTLFW